MDMIVRKEPNVTLLLVGDGEERENLRALVQKLNLSECVSFVGRVSNEKVPEYMAAADVFVLPSLSEGLPNVILEAMASGLPVVATKVRGLPEIIEDGQNGFLVEPKNPNEIAEKVCLLLEDAELRERVSRNNKEKAKGYDWDDIVKKLEMVYSDCLNSKVEKLQ
jgi:glycosyltransferase involved in cell wall biosynthesis